MELGSTEYTGWFTVRLPVVAVKDAHNLRRSQSGTWAYLEVDVAPNAIRMEVSVATDAFFPSSKDYSKCTFANFNIPVTWSRLPLHFRTWAEL